MIKVEIFLHVFLFGYSYFTRKATKTVQLVIITSEALPQTDELAA